MYVASELVFRSCRDTQKYEQRHKRHAEARTETFRYIEKYVQRHPGICGNKRKDNQGYVEVSAKTYTQAFTEPCTMLWLN